jgi:uncharacterized iron-regulated membrane protein
MTGKAFRRWVWVHKWASLVCTLFLLVVCVTGVPLVFKDEIDDWLDDGAAYSDVPADTPLANLDRFVELSRQMYPGQIIALVFRSTDEPKVLVSMAPSWKAFRADRNSRHFIRFDSRTAKVLKQSKPVNEESQTFMAVVLKLHKDLFAGFAGELFLAAMAMLFVVAIVSGVVIYGPFMRKTDFGTVRANRSSRLKWLDLHNLLGVVTLAWALVVGTTGIVNELSTPLFKIWQQTDVKALLEPFKGRETPAEAELSSVQQAFDTAQAAMPGMVVTSAVFPGAEFGSPYHYMLWTKGREPLTSRLFSPVLVDARGGALEGAVAMPWYLRALELSRPLHFGDYGGLPLKIIWLLLDIVTITVLGSGVYLWFSRGRSWGAAEASSKSMESRALPALSPEAAE